MNPILQVRVMNPTFKQRLAMRIYCYFDLSFLNIQTVEYPSCFSVRDLQPLTFVYTVKCGLYMRNCNMKYTGPLCILYEPDCNINYRGIIITYLYKYNYSNLYPQVLRSTLICQSFLCANVCIHAISWFAYFIFTTFLLCI